MVLLGIRNYRHTTYDQLLHVENEVHEKMLKAKDQIQQPNL